MNHTHIASNSLLIEPGYARTFFSALAGRLGIAQLTDAEGEIFTGDTMQMNTSSLQQ